MVYSSAKRQISLLETKLGIEKATLLCNQGHKTKFLDVYDGILITENMTEQCDYLDHEKGIRRSWQKKGFFKLNRKNIKYKKAKQNDAFPHVEDISYPAIFILGKNKAIDNTVLILILGKLISKNKVSQVFSRILQRLYVSSFYITKTW